jgi:hypothetical protein
LIQETIYDAADNIVSIVRSGLELLPRFIDTSTPGRGILGCGDIS